MSRLFCDADNWRNPTRRLISPHVGEMAGRPEGGAVGRDSPPDQSATAMPDKTQSETFHSSRESLRG